MNSMLFHIEDFAFYPIFINENCWKTSQSGDSKERKSGKEVKEGIKNQQTTNNIILTSRAIFRALMASLRGEIATKKKPKACFREKYNF